MWVGPLDLIEEEKGWKEGKEPEAAKKHPPYR